MAKFAFRTLLATLGMLLQAASASSKRFRAQITGDLVIEVRADDGPAYHFVAVAAERRIASRSGPAKGATDLSLSFSSSGQGLATLIRPDAVGKIVQQVLSGQATYSGNAAYVLWLWGLTRMVFPLGRQRRLRRAVPGVLHKPDPKSVVADRITREPAVESLDETWAGAWAAQQQTTIVRGCAGDNIPMW